MRALCALCPAVLAKPCKRRAGAEEQPRFCAVCGTWGTYGALISKVDTAHYKFFILLNSSVRGPFLPSFVPVSCRTKRVDGTRLTLGITALCIT